MSLSRERLSELLFYLALIVGGILLVVLFARQAEAIPLPPRDAVAREQGLVLAEYRMLVDELIDINGPYRVAPPRRRPTPPVTVTLPDAVEQWRPLVVQYFRPNDVEWALAIIRCESSGNPNAKNPRSSASGLFQHLARYWPNRSRKAGWEGANIFDPEANIAVAAWLLETGGKGHWVCKA